jgi:DNA-binding NtrC family response regulator
MTKILLISRSQSLINSLSERLHFENFTTESVDDANVATQRCRNEHYDAAIVDDQMKLYDTGLPTIVITRKPDVESAVNALRHGAIDYLTPPIDMNRLLATLRSLGNDEGNEEPQRTSVITRNRTPRRTNCATQPIIGSSTAIEHVRNMIRRVAP